MIFFSEHCVVSEKLPCVKINRCMNNTRTRTVAFHNVDLFIATQVYYNIYKLLTGMINYLQYWYYLVQYMCLQIYKL